MDRVDKVAFALRKREKPRVFLSYPQLFHNVWKAFKVIHISAKKFFLLQNVLFALPRGRGKNKGISGEMRAIQATAPAAGRIRGLAAKGQRFRNPCPRRR